MRKLLLSLAMLGTIALPVRAAPAMQPVLAAVVASEPATVQTVQYRYSRREAVRRQQIRRERFRRRQAARRGYYRPY